QNVAPTQGGQVSQFAQGSQNVAPTQGGQVSQFVQTAQPLATAASGENAPFAQETQNLATAQNGQGPRGAQPAGGATAYDENEGRGAKTKNALAQEFTPSVPLIPYPSAERRAPIASASYETRAERALSLLEQIDAEFERIGARVQKAVLAIETVKRTKTKATKTAVETGCGFLFQYNGKMYLATNAHVVKDATSNKSVKIFLPNQTSIHPTKIMTCVDFDLAALELDSATLPTDGSVALCYFGDSDELQVSNFVGTIGNPFGLRDTVTYGHVSSLQRRKDDFSSEGGKSLQEFIQVDAAINPGNSGGPLYNARGEVVGVVAAIATTTGKSEGVAFAIPINLALTVLKSTIDAGGWSRSHMGVELATATRADFQGVDWPIKTGSKIVGVYANSPAERAGLRSGDVVVEFDGEAIEDDVHFARLIAVADVSRAANVKFLRGARLLQTTARLERSAVK
ncbi:MAG: trypsin-like peptidase domain-containing protein, partial [Thermoguttaceae bacterium]|nr:trypsin-like peptidase domain-containing protein [Thermoguttaceae bacterium]